MKQKGRGIGGFPTFFIILIVLAVWYLFGMLGNQQVEITNAEFTKALQEKTIKSVVVVQDQEIPTGSLEIAIDGEEDARILQVSDVNEAQERLKKAGVDDIKVVDVPQESWFLTTLLPTLMIIGTILFVFFV